MMTACTGFPFRPPVPIMPTAPITATHTANTTTAVHMDNPPATHLVLEFIHHWRRPILLMRTQVAPLLRDPGDPQLPHTLLRRHPDRLSEGGERERQFGELFHPHVRRHTGGHHLDQLGRILTEHMRAQDVVPVRLGD